ncbi:MAG: hypothetical protein HPY50_10920 [Firmicutes bacterium]|nr:hypothetical protein [Bacillota bacterium]
MKKWITVPFLILLLANFLPAAALAAGSDGPPPKPYEKVAAQKGRWYADQVSYNGEVSLVTGYTGGYGGEAEAALSFKLNEELLLTGVRVPYTGGDTSGVALTLVDSRGKVYQGFRVESEPGAQTGPDSSGGPGAVPGQRLYSFTPNSSLVLPRETYTLQLKGGGRPEAAFLVRGYNYEAFQSYAEELKKWSEESKLEQPEIDFTGTYRVNLDVYKTSTLMGPVNSKTSSFSLKDFQVCILDKGGSLELIGEYEGMPFSQNCAVVEETENSVTARANFAADLSKLPYQANIAASALVTLTRTENGRTALQLKGQGTYSRAASSEKGADYNTYDVVANGGMAKKELPIFVTKALGKSNSAGSIPGPDSPAQAAAGILFPPLAGVLVNVIQGLLKPKEPPVKLSVGEQAMKDANRSLGKGLYSEEEAKAWSIMADALGNSDEPDADPFSIGDNERPGGEDYAAPDGGREEFEEQEETGQDEWQEMGIFNPDALGGPEDNPYTVFEGENPCAG